MRHTQVLFKKMRHRDTFGKIKIQHGIIGCLREKLDKLVSGVDAASSIRAVIPGRITAARGGRRDMAHKDVYFSLTTPLNGPGQGWKAIAKTAESRQELFIKTALSKEELYNAFVEAGLIPAKPNTVRSSSTTSRRTSPKASSLLHFFLLAFLTVLSAEASLRPKTWSNRAGLTLTPIVPSSTKDSPAIYAAERPFVWNNIDVGGRMAVFRITQGTNKGGLLVHSPVDLDMDLEMELKQLGDVRVIIAPNFEHLKYSSQWAKTYPDAKTWACPGLPERMPEVEWSKEMKTETIGDFDLVFFNCEQNPLTGKPFFNEVVGFYRPLKALFCSDVYWNYPGNLPTPNYAGEMDVQVPDFKVPGNTRAWKLGMDRLYLPFYRNVMTLGKKEEFAACTDKILSFEAEIIVPCHGDIVRGKELCSKVLEEHFGRQV